MMPKQINAEIQSIIITYTLHPSDQATKRTHVDVLIIIYEMHRNLVYTLLRWCSSLLFFFVLRREILFLLQKRCDRFEGITDWRQINWQWIEISIISNANVERLQNKKLFMWFCYRATVAAMAMAMAAWHETNCVLRALDKLCRWNIECAAMMINIIMWWSTQNIKSTKYSSAHAHSTLQHTFIQLVVVNEKEMHYLVRNGQPFIVRTRVHDESHGSEEK